MVKKLSVAFVWHLHQPDYKDPETNQYLMPWVRLHAIKDYLDMLLILDDFPNIKQTFNISPLLIDQLEDYAHNDVHDLHSALMVQPIESLSKEDKIFILNSFFDANYDSMIEPSRKYKELYEKRYSSDVPDVDDFSEQEYSDIMACFNLVWFDPYWKKNNDELKKLISKGKNYTLDDRIQILEIQREIIRQVLPTYKKHFDSGKIEISTSPYYHPILPLLLDTDCAKEGLPSSDMPKHRYSSVDDAVYQIEKSIGKFEETFGQKPKGIWPPEHCISDRMIKMCNDLGFSWTISDEGVLAKSLGKEFVRNFDGILKDPYDLCNSYSYGKEDNEFNILFRSSYLTNLISFQYGAREHKAAANDLYERIKIAQDTLNSSPEEHHVLTIAMDCENCWESYPEDGSLFLIELYKLLSEDESLDVTTVSDYIAKIDKKIPLDNIYSGSWVGRNFGMWIGDPIKNLAWDHLYKIKSELVEFSGQNYPKEKLEQAWNEFHVALGSDWLWWFGEPNDSGQDELFDFLFRKHLVRIYQILEKEIPDYLKMPLLEYYETSQIALDDAAEPDLDNLVSEEEWQATTCIQPYLGPMHNVEKLVKKVCFGSDEKNIYLQFSINHAALKSIQEDNLLGQLFIYFKGVDINSTTSPVRVKVTKDSPSQILRNVYSHEIEVPIIKDTVMPLAFSRSIEGSMWGVVLGHNIKFKYDKVVEMAIPFDELNIKSGEKVSMVMLSANSSIISEVVTPDKPIIMIRP